MTDNHIRSVLNDKQFRSFQLGTAAWHFLATFLFMLLAIVTLATANPVPTDNLKHKVRDDWSPVNTTMACMFMTSEPNWTGEMQNLCKIGGVCGTSILCVRALGG